MIAPSHTTSLKPPLYPKIASINGMKNLPPNSPDLTAFSREDILAAKPSDAPAKPEEQLVSALRGTGHYTALKTQFSSQKGLFHC